MTPKDYTVVEAETVGDLEAEVFKYITDGWRATA